MFMVWVDFVLWISAQLGKRNVFGIFVIIWAVSNQFANGWMPSAWEPQATLTRMPPFCDTFHSVASVENSFTVAPEVIIYSNVPYVVLVGVINFQFAWLEPSAKCDSDTHNASLSLSRSLQFSLSPCLCIPRCATIDRVLLVAQRIALDTGIDNNKKKRRRRLRRSSWPIVCSATLGHGSSVAHTSNYYTHCAEALALPLYPVCVQFSFFLFFFGFSAYIKNNNSLYALWTSKLLVFSFIHATTWWVQLVGVAHK